MLALFIALIIGLGLALLALVSAVIHVQAKRRQDAADRALMDCERAR